MKCEHGRPQSICAECYTDERESELQPEAQESDGIHSGVIPEDLRHLVLRPNEIVMRAPKPEEPDNARCARALGWTDVHFEHGYLTGHCPGWRGMTSVPDFSADAVWVVRMQTANGLNVGPCQDGWRAGVGIARGAYGVAPGHAVVAWVIAAAEAGVKVKR